MSNLCKKHMFTCKTCVSMRQPRGILSCTDVVEHKRSIWPLMYGAIQTVRYGPISYRTFSMEQVQSCMIKYRIPHSLQPIQSIVSSPAPSSAHQWGLAPWRPPVGPESPHWCIHQQHSWKMKQDKLLIGAIAFSSSVSTQNYSTHTYVALYPGFPHFTAKGKAWYEATHVCTSTWAC